jgi:hypothetical protein
MPNTTIQLTNGNDPIAQPVTHTSSDVAHRTLGVWPAPSGCNQEQFQQCHSKSNQIAEGVRHGHMGPNEALMGYTHIYLPSVGYALACWPLDAVQLKKLTSSAVNAFLPKMGFCRKMSRNLIFGSKQLQGYGLTPLINYQGVNQTTLLLTRLGKCWPLDTHGFKHTAAWETKHYWTRLASYPMPRRAGSSTFALSWTGATSPSNCLPIPSDSLSYSVEAT